MVSVNKDTICCNGAFEPICHNCTIPKDERSCQDTPDKPLLTIAIPTYNRLEYLKELLPGMIEQCKQHPEIEILISDNNSIDGSWSYICDLARDSLKLRIRLNVENVGADENFVRCVEEATGKYIWLFGDDEILCEGGIDKIISTLETHPVALLIVGHTRRINPGIGSQFFRTYKEFVDCVEPIIVLEHTLITCNIFRKSIFDTAIARKYQSTNYGHMRAIIHSLRKRGTVYFLDYPVYIIRDVCAPFQEPIPTYPAFKHMWYLLWIETVYPKMLSYAGKYIIGAVYYKIFRR